jgi:hypothetical protein
VNSYKISTQVYYRTQEKNEPDERSFAFLQCSINLILVIFDIKGVLMYENIFTFSTGSEMFSGVRFSKAETLLSHAFDVFSE